MAAPAITEENLRNQIDVVKEEIRVNVLNRPYGAFPWLQLPGIAFESFANTHDGYGSFVDLESSTVDDTADFFHRYYAPGNAVLCLGGDLDVGEAEQLVRRWFGPVAAREVPPTPPTGEPSPTSVRSGVVEDPLAPAPAVALGWRVPDPVGDLDTYLGTVLLAELLSGGDASRLERRLGDDDQPAVAQSSYVGLFGDPFDVRDATLLTTQVHHPASVPTEKVVTAVHEEVGRIAQDGVGARRVPSGCGRGGAAGPRAGVHPAAGGAAAPARAGRHRGDAAQRAPAGRRPAARRPAGRAAAAGALRRRDRARRRAAHRPRLGALRRRAPRHRRARRHRHRRGAADPRRGAVGLHPPPPAAVRPPPAPGGGRARPRLPPGPAGPGRGRGAPPRRCRSSRPARSRWSTGPGRCSPTC